MNEELKPYFTRELFESIGEERIDNLASYVDDALNNDLNDYHTDRISDINALLQRGHPGFIEGNILVDNFNDYYNREKRKIAESYGYEKEQIVELLEFIKENPNHLSEINKDDIDLFSEIVISSDSMRNFFSNEIARLVNHARQTEVYATLDNRTISNVYDLIAFNSNNNQSDTMPFYIFTYSWFFMILKTSKL